MSTSELRRGPGWWMDLDGSWKPPEHWPESSPPLPGWVRDDAGLWAPPAGGYESNGTNGSGTNEAGSAPNRAASTAPRTGPPNRPRRALYVVDPISPDGPASTETEPDSASPDGNPRLSFAQHTAHVRPGEDVDRGRRAAASAAGLAAMTALMLAAGLIVLLALIFS